MKYINNEGYSDPTAGGALRNIEYGERHPQMVYIASPFAGNVEENVKKAKKYCRYAVDKGFLPVAPHLLFPQFMNDDDPDDRETAMNMNRVLLSRCKQLWVCGDRISPGMQQEIRWARCRGIPIKKSPIRRFKE